MIKKEHIIPLISLCGTILISCLILSKPNLNISNSEFEHSITVEWLWEVYATPDTVVININIEEKNKKTTKEAQKWLDEKTDAVKKLLANYNIKESDIKTQHTSTYEDYDWTDTGRVSKWFVGNHSLQIKIKDANTDNKWIESKIISELSEIEWVFVNNIFYDIYDKWEYYSQARELAVEKAHQKAEDLAKYAGVKLWDAISISEWRSNDYAIKSATANSKFMAINWMWVDEEMEVIDYDWWVSLWEMKIQLNVSILYAID